MGYAANKLRQRFGLRIRIVIEGRRQEPVRRKIQNGWLPVDGLLMAMEPMRTPLIADLG